MTEKSCNLSEQQVDLPQEQKVEPVEPVQMNMYQTNTYRKDVSWPYLHEEPRVSTEAADERPTVLYVYADNLTIPSSKQE